MADTLEATAYDEADTCWHLLVTTRKGKVSILQNLDARTARQAYQRLMPDTRPVEYINVPESGSWGYCTGGRIASRDDDWVQKVDILGPEGAELNPWHGVQPAIIDVDEIRRRNPSSFYS